MKIVLLLIVFLVFKISVHAQSCENDSVIIANEDSCDTEEIQPVIDAFLMLAKSAESKDTLAIREALIAMKDCRLSIFGALKNESEEDEESLDGHLVFNVFFADSLASGKDAYENAEKIDSLFTLKRDSMQSGSILTKTCLIGANKKSTYTFDSRERQELAVIAEPGGLITTRVHVVNESKGVNEWHNDIVDVAKGRNSRKTAFTLPRSPKSKVTLEITNCINKNISVVIISN